MFSRMTKGKVESAELTVDGEKVFEVSMTPQQSLVNESANPPNLEESNLSGRTLWVDGAFVFRFGTGHGPGKKLFV